MHLCQVVSLKEPFHNCQAAGQPIPSEGCSMVLHQPLARGIFLEEDSVHCTFMGKHVEVQQFGRSAKLR